MNLGVRARALSKGNHRYIIRDFNLKGRHSKENVFEESSEKNDNHHTVSFTTDVKMATAEQDDNSADKVPKVGLEIADA